MRASGNEQGINKLRPKAFCENIQMKKDFCAKLTFYQQIFLYPHSFPWQTNSHKKSKVKTLFVDGLSWVGGRILSRQNLSNVTKFVCQWSLKGHFGQWIDIHCDTTVQNKSRDLYCQGIIQEFNLGAGSHVSITL